MSRTEEPVVVAEFLETVGALHDPARVRLLAHLDRHGPLCVCDLQRSFGMIQSRLSRHLKILLEAGFLRVRKEGRWSHYAIRSPSTASASGPSMGSAPSPLELPEAPDAGCTVSRGETEKG